MSSAFMLLNFMLIGTINRNDANTNVFSFLIPSSIQNTAVASSLTFPDQVTISPNSAHQLTVPINSSFHKPVDEDTTFIPGFGNTQNSTNAAARLPLSIKPESNQSSQVKLLQRFIQWIGDAKTRFNLSIKTPTILQNYYVSHKFPSEPQYHEIADIVKELLDSPYAESFVGSEGVEEYRLKFSATLLPLHSRRPPRNRTRLANLITPKNMELKNIR